MKKIIYLAVLVIGIMIWTFFNSADASELYTNENEIFEHLNQVQTCFIDSDEAFVVGRVVVEDIWYLTTIEFEAYKSVIGFDSDISVSIVQTPTGTIIASTTVSHTVFAAGATRKVWATADFSDQNIILSNFADFYDIAYHAIGNPTVGSLIFSIDKEAAPTNFDVICTDPLTIADGYVTTSIKGFPINYINLVSSVIPSVNAAACTFVTTGVTTTAACDDPITRNDTQDYFNGLILFLVLMGATLVGLEFMNNKKKKFND